jgi:Spy/CpxP family protein refolding chaperone
MSKFPQNTRMNGLRLSSILFGSVALIALMSAAPVAPALAQSAPAGLLRLDPPQPSNDGIKLTEDQRAKVRSAYARARKSQAQ